MKALFTSVKFETETGLVEIGQHENGTWFFEWKDGYSFGMYSPHPFKTFDMAYNAMKKTLKTEIKNRLYE